MFPNLPATKWSRDPSSCSSYSAFTVGATDGIEDIEILRIGMPEAGIWLVGEHAGPLGGNGTVYRAYVSG